MLYLDNTPPPTKVTHLTDKEQKEWVKEVQGLSEQYAAFLFTLFVICNKFINKDYCVSNEADSFTDRLMYIMDTEMAIAKSQAISWLLRDFQVFISLHRNSMVLENFCTNQWICTIEFDLRHQIFERYTVF